MSTTNLRKFSTTIYRDAGGADSRQIPAEAATCSVFRQGATVSSIAFVSTAVGGVPIPVFDYGQVEVGDEVKVMISSFFVGPSVGMEVVSIDLVNQQISLRAASGSVIVNTGDRLVITGPTVPELWIENQGVAAANNPIETNALGYVEFYTQERQFDMYVTGSGLEPKVYQDEESGQIPARRTHYNIMDFPASAPQGGAKVSVQLALDSIPSGSKLYFPAEEGPFIPPDAAGWDIEKPVEIFSDGRGGSESLGFKYYGGASNQNSVVFQLGNAIHNVYLHDFTISNDSGTPAAGGTGDAIRYSGASIGQSLRMERVGVFYAGRHGLYLNGADFYVQLTLRDCTFFGCRGDGINLDAVTAILIEGTSCAANKGMGGRLVNCGSGIVIELSDFSSNGDDLVNTTYDGQLYLESCSGYVILSTDFEDFHATTIKKAIVLNNCNGGVVAGNALGNPAAVADSEGIFITNSCRNNTILSNSFGLVDTAVRIDATTEIGNVVMPQFPAVSGVNARCRVLFPTNGRNFIYVIDQQSGVSNSKGVGIVLPNLSTASATISTSDASTDVTSAAFEGMLAYSSANKKLYVLTAANTWTAQT